MKHGAKMKSEKDINGKRVFQEIAQTVTRKTKNELRGGQEKESESITRFTK